MSAGESLKLTEGVYYAFVCGDMTELIILSKQVCDEKKTEKSFECEICDVLLKAYDKDSHLTTHAKFCHDCDEIYLKNHICFSKKCFLCATTFESHFEYNFHIDTHSYLNLPDRYCSFCQRYFSTKALYSQHLKDIHDAYAICDECKILLKSKNAMKYHKKKNHELSTCFHCLLRVNSYRINDHQSSHCTVCEKCSLPHIQNTFCFCNNCCFICKELFSTKINVIKHLKELHDFIVEDNICVICKVIFPQSSIGQHNRKMHKFYKLCALCGVKHGSKKDYELHKC